jgi:hypothetical protein
MVFDLLVIFIHSFCAFIYVSWSDITCITGPVNNIHVLNRPAYLNPRSLSNVQASSRRHGLSLPPPLSKYINTMDEKVISAAVNLQATCNNPLDASCISSQVINCQIKELQVLNCSTIFFLHFFLCRSLHWIFSITATVMNVVLERAP